MRQYCGGGHTIQYTYSVVHSIASSNFSFRIFVCAIFWRGEKCDGALVTPPGPLFEGLTDLDGRAVEVKGDGGVCVARVLNTMKPNGI
jgi:hypothetical protein